MTPTDLFKHNTPINKNCHNILFSEKLFFTKHTTQTKMMSYITNEYTFSGINGVYGDNKYYDCNIIHGFHFAGTRL